MEVETSGRRKPPPSPFYAAVRLSRPTVAASPPSVPTSTLGLRLQPRSDTACCLHYSLTPCPRHCSPSRSHRSLSSSFGLPIVIASLSLSPRRILQISHTTTRPPSASPSYAAIVSPPPSPGSTDPTSSPPRMPPICSLSWLLPLFSLVLPLSPSRFHTRNNNNPRNSLSTIVAPHNCGRHCRQTVVAHHCPSLSLSLSLPVRPSLSPFSLCHSFLPVSHHLTLSLIVNRQQPAAAVTARPLPLPPIAAELPAVGRLSLSLGLQPNIYIFKSTCTWVR